MTGVFTLLVDWAINEAISGYQFELFWSHVIIVEACGRRDHLREGIRLFLRGLLGGWRGFRVVREFEMMVGMMVGGGR